MEKRSNKRSNNKKQNITANVKKITLFVIFLMFTLISIYVVDTSTNRIMNSKEDKRALGICFSSDNSLQIDIVGEKYYFETEKLINIIGDVNRGLVKIKWKIHNFLIDKWGISY